MHSLMDRNAVAVTTYRRANGSQAQVSRPRVVRAPRVFPLAKTPSQAARRLANARRRHCECAPYRPASAGPDWHLSICGLAPRSLLVEG